jgi:hypothetical protein
LWLARCFPAERARSVKPPEPFVFNGRLRSALDACGVAHSQKREPMRQKTMPPAGRGRQFRNVREAVWHCKKIGGSAKLIALRLVEHLPDAFPSLLTLAGWTGLSERTVRVALRELEAKRVVETRRTGRTNVYAFAFVGVSIPELGLDGDDAPPASGEDDAPAGEDDAPAGEDDAPESGGREAQHRQNLPVLPNDHTPAESADQTGRICRSDRQKLPPKQGSEAVKRSRRSRSAAARGREAAPPPAPALFTSWFGWKLSPELRAELVAAGIAPDRVEHRVLKLKNRGVRRGGVLNLDDYIREQIPQWLVWEAEEMAKRGAGNGVSSAVQGGGAPLGRPGESGAPARRSGPKWIHVDHVAFARSAGLDSLAEARRFRATYYAGRSVLDGMHACDLYAPFMDHLKRAAAAASEAA